ncbi:hypothetical protein BDW22DRAFT_1331518 [Trametopsis cervina]|nr:hypothetical protein BDW22DRAFT_1331518 [Trametopsis cervina]
MFARSIRHVRTLSSTSLLPSKEESPRWLRNGNAHRPFFPSIMFRRRRVLLLAIGVVSLCLVVLHISSSTPPHVERVASPWSASSEINAPNDTENTSPVVIPHPPWVLGPPTPKFRDNLLADRKYVTSWYAAGWNNDVITMMNLIYLAKITDRIPIIPTFTPSWHIGGDAPGITFGEIFDVPRFIQETGIELLEWHQVKDPASTEVEEIGCWSVWQAVQNFEDQPRGSDVPKWLNLDIAYTKAPEWIKLLPGNEHDRGSSFWALARLAYSEDRDKSLRQDVLQSPKNGAVVHPDEQLLCYDYLYYVGSHQWFEYENEYSPAWRKVGAHLHWTEDIEQLAAQYVNTVFGLPLNRPPPPYITVHVRHGDFAEWCWDAETVEECFAPLSAIARRVREVQAELLERFDINVPMEHVIVTSDEKDEDWWAQVETYGWKRMNHDQQRTATRFSRWHPLIVDSAIQSNGIGFVGNDRSTFSTLSRRRVMDWHDGVVRTVLWGKKGADDH